MEDSGCGDLGHIGLASAGGETLDAYWSISEYFEGGIDAVFAEVISI